MSLIMPEENMNEFEVWMNLNSVESDEVWLSEWRCVQFNQLPADFHLKAGIERVNRPCAILEVTDVEVWECVINEAVHGAVITVHVLIHQPGDEVRGEGDDEGLGDMQNTLITFK